MSRVGRLVPVLLAVTTLLCSCARPAAGGWSGYVEGEYVYAAAPLAGALSSVSVIRGQQVARGAPMFVLDSDAERAAREEAGARLATARAQAANTGKGRRGEEIAVIEAQLAQARTQAAYAVTELARQRKLVEQGFVSAAALDSANSTARQTRAHADELEASLRVARLPARSDEREAASATAEAAQYALEQALWREQQKSQLAPADAQVADVYYRPGEWVAAGAPVVALLPPGGTKARFFVPEGELGAIALNQPVTIWCDGCAEPIAARISFIATQAEYTPPVIYSNTQRARLVFMVEARPDIRDGPKLRPGQPVEVRRPAATAP